MHLSRLRFLKNYKNVNLNYEVSVKTLLLNCFINNTLLKCVSVITGEKERDFTPSYQLLLSSLGIIYRPTFLSFIEAVLSIETIAMVIQGTYREKRRSKTS